MNTFNSTQFMVRRQDLIFCATLSLLALALFMWAKLQVLPGLQGPVTFDGAYYLDIATHGYGFDGYIEHKQNIAFLPLTAGEIKIATWLIPGQNEFVEVMLAGVLVLFGTLVGIFALCAGFAGSTAGRIATLLWAGSPMALYNFVGYSEPLFALLCAWAFVALYRNALWMATILAALALLGRPQALVLVVFVAFVLAQSARWRLVEFLRGPGPVQLSIMVMPLMAYATWQAVQLGDSTAYVNALEAWRRGGSVDGNQSWLPAFLGFFSAVSSESAGLTRWTTMLASSALAMIVATFTLSAGAPLRLVVFQVGLLTFLFITASFDTMNIARHTFFMFPWAVLAALAIARQPAREVGKYVALAPVLFVSCVINYHAVIRYFTGEWVS